MKILVLAQSYPSTTNLYSQAFIHSRNVIYSKHGIDVEVCSFSATDAYSFSEIKVFPPSHIRSLRDYDLVLSHAPNLRNHFRFLIFRWRELKNIIFFLHGYEVMDVAKYVDPWFTFLKPSLPKRIVSRLYDKMKLPILRLLFSTFLKNKNTEIVSVSRSFLSWAESDLKMSLGCAKVIPNSINPIFENESFKPLQFKGDFVSIRPFDEPKYAVDLLVELAKRNPQYSFHLYGRGRLFEHIKAPENLKVFTTFLKQEEIPALLDQYRFAVMLSRCDAQGVMACEMASYGIPLLVSKMPVFEEVFDGFTNVKMVSNSLDFDLSEVINSLEPAEEKNHAFSGQRTVGEEISLMKSMVSK